MISIDPCPSKSGPFHTSGSRVREMVNETVFQEAFVHDLKLFDL